MTPFQQFRLWLRRAPVGERVSAGLAGAVALALLVWVLVPAGSDSNGEFEVGTGPAATEAGGEADATAEAAGDGMTEASPGDGGDGAPGGAAPSTGGFGAGTSTGGGGGATTGSETAATGEAATSATTTTAPPSGSGGTTTAGGGCVSPPGSDQGVTQKEIKAAIILVNIVGPAGNETFGVPPADEQRLDYEQVIENINATGGVACRKLVAQFYVGNPADNSDRQAKCLDIVQARPLFVIDAGAYYGSPLSNCYPQHQLPFMSTSRVTNSQRQQFYPYMFSTGNMEELYRNMVFALRDRGFFKPESGFKKIGFAYRSCFADVNSAFVGWLKQAGVPSDAIVEYDFGCPSGFASPTDIQQAILKFQGAGVTHMTSSQFTPDFPNFTKIAQQQGFRPKWGIADDGIVPTTKGNLAPDYDNIADAIAIAGDRYGEEDTPGMSPTPGTQKCDAIFKAKGRPPVYRQAVGFGGVACSQLWVMAAAVSKAPALKRSALAEGLRLQKTIDLSFPRGPADFTGTKVTYGGQFWRPLQFMKVCNCWRVLDATFKPSFK